MNSLSKKKIFIKSSTALFLLLVPALICIDFNSSIHTRVVSAQSIEDIGQNDVFIKVEQKNPTPGTLVNMEAVSYLYNIDTMYIEWYVNGKLTLSGIGEKNLDYTIPLDAKKTLILLRLVDKETNDKVETSLSLDSESLILLWQVENSITPPFYKGKPLGSGESSITYSVLPKNLLETAEYYWSVDYKKDLKASGANKSSFTKKYSLLDTSSTVDIEKNVNGQSRGSERYIQVFQNPKLVWYPYLQSDYVDIWNGYDKNFTVVASPLKLIAFPYNFTVNNIDTLDFVYKLDDEYLPEKKNEKNILEFETTKGGGRATLKTHIEHPDLIQQEHDSTLLLKF